MYAIIHKNIYIYTWEISVLKWMHFISLSILRWLDKVELQAIKLTNRCYFTLLLLPYQCSESDE